jgi:hypothetical protein
MISDTPFEYCKRCKHYKEPGPGVQYIYPCKTFEPQVNIKAKIKAKYLNLKWKLMRWLFKLAFKHVFENDREREE